MENITQKSKKIRKGDKVVAISGNYRGRFGIVLSCSGTKAIVQGLNLRKKHVKPSEANQRGGIIELEGPIHISNLKVCVGDNKAVKLKVRSVKDGERQLVYNDGDQEVLYRSLKKNN
ncbi:MAG: 50S ribosomal protein L24 [Parachlamydiaceae bacterium]|nr:50S ribosomal protein L24 [Parachlamydiaceae bacterium]